MKKSYFFILLFIANVFIFSQSISVTTPDGGDYWNIGETREIEWNFRGDMHSYVKIRMYDKTGSSKLLDITDRTLNNGKFEWTLPPSLREGEYIIRVKTIDNNVFDDSAIFHIQDRRQIKLTLISPSGGEQYVAPGNMLFKWEMENGHLVENIRLILKKGGVEKSQKIVNNSLSFTAPLTDNINDGIDYSVRIEDADDPAIFDESGNFKIYHSSAPGIRILKPNGAKYGVGETMNIEWECTGFDGVVNVDLYKDGFPNRNLASSIRDNFHNWDISIIQVGNYQIRVSSVENSDIFALSNRFDVLSYTDLIVFSRRGILDKVKFMKGENTTLRFSINNQFNRTVPITFKINFYGGKVIRPSGISTEKYFLYANTKYTGDKTSVARPAADTSFNLPVMINDRPGDYTVVITVLPADSSQFIDQHPENNTIYGYFKVVLKTLELKEIK